MAIPQRSLPPPRTPEVLPGRRTKPRRTGLWVTVTLLVLALAGGGIAAVLFYRGVGESLRPAQSAAEEFILDLESSDWAGAYERLCREAQTDYSVDEFAKLSVSSGEVRNHTITRTYVTEMNDEVRATVIVQLDLADGGRDTHTFHLVQEGQEWKVCGRPY